MKSSVARRQLDLVGRLLLAGASLPLLAENPARFREHTIASDLKGGYQVVAVDMNRDGRTDLIGLASGMPELVWFENPTWKRHVIARGFNRMINLGAWDTDGDGIPEIVVAHEFANQARNSIGIVSLLQHQGDPLQPWKVTEIDRLTTSHRIRWAAIEGKGARVAVNAPLTGAKAEAPDYRDNTPLVFYRPGEWKRQSIGDENEGVVHGIFVADWDGDGRDDILTASFVGIHVYRLNRGKWTRTEIARGDPAEWPKSGASDIAIGHIRKRRFLASIEPWHGNQVVVYDDGGKTRRVIDESLEDGHTIVTGDLNGDGSDEIVAGFRRGKRSVYVYYATDGKGERWEKRVLDDGGIAAAACAASDLNGDRRLDLACIGSSTTNLKWYENLGPER
ncbi:MAG: FG-GAP and VCBS repeat-containing protein [Bryobacteraceae bacterium]